MVFLVDFENTNSSGMEGCGYLNSTDTVVLFYSASSMTIKRKYARQLKESGARVKLYKLVCPRSNALDLYIASSTGLYVGQQVCIVSKDKGYLSVRDFWKLEGGVNIVTGETIEACISRCTNDPRGLTVLEEMQTENLENLFFENPVKEETAKKVYEEVLKEPVDFENDLNFHKETSEERTETRITFPNLKDLEEKKEDSLEETTETEKQHEVGVQMNLPLVENMTIAEASETEEETVLEEDREAKEKQAQKEARNERKKQRREALMKVGLDSKTIRKINVILNEAKNLREIYQKIVKLLGMDMGRTVYNEIKKFQ